LGARPCAELILRAGGSDQPYPPAGREARLVAVLLDEIEMAPVVPLLLPTPKDARLLAVTSRLAEDQGDRRSRTAIAYAGSFVHLLG